MLRSIFGRRNPKLALEDITEIIRIRITNAFCYDIAFFIRLHQQAGSLFHTILRQISDKRIPRLLLENRGKVRIRYPQRLADMIQRKIFIRIMIVNI